MIDVVLTLLAVLCMLIGAGFCLVASIGLVRLPDALTRMHAATKAGTLGIGLLLIGAAIGFADTQVALKALAIVLFLLFTAPIAAHLIGKVVWDQGRHSDNGWHPPGDD